MDPQTGAPTLSFDERKLQLEERRLALESSFARKWLPTLVTLMAGLIAATFGYVQQQSSMQATERTRIEASRATQEARIEARAKDEREAGFKVIELYLSRPELFDFSKHSKEAAMNLRFLAAVAPNAVQGVLNAELTNIARPTDDDDTHRLASLADFASVQSALATSRQANVAIRGGDASVPNLTIYLQYPEEHRELATQARNVLEGLGYQVPGIEQVRKPPSRLQVRYYREEQRARAEELAKKLGAQLGLPTSADNAIRVTSAKELPTGILEVWVP